VTDDTMTHTERWYRMGWIVRWDDDARSYIACRVRYSGDWSADAWHYFTTIQDVDAWIAEHEAGRVT